MMNCTVFAKIDKINKTRGTMQNAPQGSYLLCEYQNRETSPACPARPALKRKINNK